MKRWAIITVTLYALLLLLLTMPAILLFGARWVSTPEGPRGWGFDIGPQEVLPLFQQWGYWLWLAVFVSAQALLLVVPVKMA